MASSAPHSTSLIERYSGKDHKKGFYLFKNSGTGQNKYHITKKSSADSLCSHYSLDRQHHNNKFPPKKLELGMSLSELEDLAGIGKGICKQCLFQWQENL